MPLTYRPKIKGVLNGTIRQTIRKAPQGADAIMKYMPDDAILFHTWKGKPYRTKWGKRHRVTLTEVHGVRLEERGIGVVCEGYECVVYVWHTWHSKYADALAKTDGIAPPTGIALRNVIKKYHGKAWEGLYHVLRW